MVINFVNERNALTMIIKFAHIKENVNIQKNYVGLNNM